MVVFVATASTTLQIRVGQDFSQAPGRVLDPFLDVFHGLSEVFDVVKPKIVAYVASPGESGDIVILILISY